MIDEVDSASNNQVFVDFLAMLRGYYLKREDIPTFHSVILAGLYDIKNLKLRIRPDMELKIWHGNEYNERGREQLTEYLNYYHLKKGYLLSFNFSADIRQGGLSCSSSATAEVPLLQAI